MRQAQALAVLLSGRSVFLTGPPGAGKTYVLNQYIARAKRLGKTVGITASTGIAATHIGGTTIHSWSGLGIRDRLEPQDRAWLIKNERLKKRYLATDVLVIDEVSMLHGARLDMVDEACRLMRGDDQPFGGMQAVLVGDLFQLPPVTRDPQEGQEVDFVHRSKVWLELDLAVCYISEQHRQTGDGLLDVLEAMRRSDLSDQHRRIIAPRLGLQPESDSKITRLYAHNIDVDTINQKHLDALPGESYRYEMRSRGSAAKVEQLCRGVLAPQVLELKENSEVMCVTNNFAKGYVNGSRGTVVRFEEELPIVKLSGGKLVRIEPHSWTLSEDGKTRAEVAQLPLRLAWAITIHKSQGMSLDSAEIDLSQTFEPGMGYVALSRVRRLDGLYIKGANKMAFSLHQDIYDFDREIKKLSDELAVETKDASAEVEPVIDRELSVDKVLYDQLAKWRLGRAKADKVAPYIVAHNKVLEQIAAKKPQTQSQLMSIDGFGPKKYDTYGQDILNLVRDYTNASQA